MKFLSTFLKRASLSSIPLLFLCLLLIPATARAVGTPAGTTITNHATVTYHDEKSNDYQALSNDITITVSEVYAVFVDCESNKSANAYTEAFYWCTVQNIGNATASFNLSASAATTGWTTTLYADDGTGTGGHANNKTREDGEQTIIDKTGNIAADATYYFFMAVRSPQHTTNGTKSDATLTVVGPDTLTGADDASVTRTTTALAPALSVTKKIRNVTKAGEFGSTCNAKPGETLEYQIEVKNGGAVKATNVVLTDTLNATLTYLLNSLWAGNSTDYTGISNRSDSSSGDGSCGLDACGAANYNDTTRQLTFYLGTGADESKGGSLEVGSSVFVYYHVKVN